MQQPALDRTQLPHCRNSGLLKLCAPTCRSDCTWPWGLAQEATINKRWKHGICHADASG
jgi:hypothetical protein